MSQQRRLQQPWLIRLVTHFVANPLHSTQQKKQETSVGLEELLYLFMHKLCPPLLIHELLITSPLNFPLLRSLHSSTHTAFTVTSSINSLNSAMENYFKCWIAQITWGEEMQCKNWISNTICLPLLLIHHLHSPELFLCLHFDLSCHFAVCTNKCFCNHQ